MSQAREHQAQQPNDEVRRAMQLSRWRNSEDNNFVHPAEVFCYTYEQEVLDQLEAVKQVFVEMEKRCVLPLDIYMLIFSLVSGMYWTERLYPFMVTCPRKNRLIADLQYLNFWNEDQPTRFTFHYFNVSIFNSMYNPIAHRLVSQAYKRRYFEKRMKEQTGEFPTILSYYEK